jgi:hypothetical protein
MRRARINFGVRVPSGLRQPARFNTDAGGLHPAGVFTPTILHTGERVAALGRFPLPEAAIG